jgi:thymidylate kinase
VNPNSTKKLFVVVIDGPMGSGKTTVSKLLNEKLEGTARVALADVKRFISGFEKDHNYNVVSQEIILVMVEEYLKRGISVIVEWAMKKERAEAFKEIAKKYNAQHFIYQLDAPKSLLIERVKERTGTLLDKSELPEKNIKNIEENFEKNYSFHIENKHDDVAVIDSEKLSPEQIVDHIIGEITTA